MRETTDFQPSPHGGRVVAESAADEASGNQIEEIGRLAAEERAAWIVSPAFANRLRDVLLPGLGIVRNEAGMMKALDGVDALTPETAAEHERVALGRAMLLSALSRRESRGAHCRTDCPERDESFRKTTVATQTDGEIKIAFRAIPERRADA